MLKSIGMHRVFQPKKFGGLENLPTRIHRLVSPRWLAPVAERPGLFSLLCTHSHQIAMFSPKLQQEVWGDNPDATASSSIAPFGPY
ncbi:p-hydroxyphenylacetate 3-hydroxylase, oxygenase component [Serratia fonticola]|uniref:p-hydroxyphenylacetate 3-hydroxylase, oxygenase component n=1 Tax=Serratia fonticola TaxID=47917 RepID=A0A4U9U0L7_SERFO|nr:p-hydroxyphenylacetate 3-hydroxylase, oxygenase component [Serratia fonticola]